jgi:hypothetical protein
MPVIGPIIPNDEFEDDLWRSMAPPEHQQRPRRYDYRFAFPTRADAQRFRNCCAEAGQAVEDTEYTGSALPWEVTVAAVLPPSLMDLATFEHRLTALAALANGHLQPRPAP